MALGLCGLLGLGACTTASGARPPRPEARTEAGAEKPAERQVILSDDRELEGEKELGRQAAEEVARETGLVSDPELVAYVKSIGERVAARSPRTDVEYTFQIADTPDVNAFALPGGYIFVTRGLLALTNSEAELANVLAHEVGHVAARHFAERQSRARNVGMLSTVGMLAAAVMGSGEAAQLLLGLSQTVGAGYLAAYGRDQEREADDMGQRMAAMAGWDPRGMSDFLDTLDRNTQVELGERPKSSFLATHPSTPERVAVTSARARQLTPSGELQGPSREAFLERLRGLVVGVDPAQGLFEEQTFLHRDFDLRIEFPTGWVTRNTSSAVGAVSQNQAALLKLELQGPGSDVREAAASYMAGLRGRVLRKNGLRVGGLPAYRAVIVEGESAVEITWFTHRDVVFRLTGVTEAPRYPNRYERLFGETARSIRPLRPDEIERIERTTLDVREARAGETLRAFSERTGNRWSLEQTAAANRIFAYDPLSAGQQVKIAVGAVYQPRDTKGAGSLPEAEDRPAMTSARASSWQEW